MRNFGEEAVKYRFLGEPVVKDRSTNSFLFILFLRKRLFCPVKLAYTDMSPKLLFIVIHMNAHPTGQNLDVDIVRLWLVNLIKQLHAVVSAHLQGSICP